MLCLAFDSCVSLAGSVFSWLKWRASYTHRVTHSTYRTDMVLTVLHQRSTQHPGWAGQSEWLSWCFDSGDVGSGHDTTASCATAAALMPLPVDHWHIMEEAMCQLYDGYFGLTMCGVTFYDFNNVESDKYICFKKVFASLTRYTDIQTSETAMTNGIQT